MRLDWDEHWTRLWRHQPALWVLTAALAVLGAAAVWASVRGAQQQAAWMYDAFLRAQAANEPPDTRVFAALSGWQSLSVLLGLVMLALDVLVYWTVGLAFEHPERPLPWYAPWRRAWVPWLRALLAHVLRSLALGLAAAVLFLPLTLVLVLAVFVCSPVPVVLALWVLSVWLVWWLLPWWVNWIVAAVLEHPAGPPEVWRRYWGVMKTYRDDFRPLAGMHLALLVFVMGPAQALAVYPWLAMVVRGDPWARPPEVPPWVWVAAPLLGALGWGALAYVKVGWASAYGWASRAWRANIQRLAAARRASTEVSHE